MQVFSSFVEQLLRPERTNSADVVSSTKMVTWGFDLHPQQYLVEPPPDRAGIEYVWVLLDGPVISAT